MPSFQKNASSGLWSVRFREVQPDGTTKDRRLSKHPTTGEKFHTKKAAQYGYADYLSCEVAKEAAKPIGAAITPPKSKTPLTVLFRAFLTYKRQRTKPSTVYTVQKNIESQVLPFFGEMCVEDITPALILDWLGTLSDLSDNYTKTSFTNRSAVKRDVELVLPWALEKKIPFIVGTAGGAGSDVHLQWMREIVEEIAAEKGLKLL